MAFEDTGWIELRPITLLFGRNSGSDAHQQVRTDLNRRPERAAKDIARMLRDVQFERNRADYDDNYNVSDNLTAVFDRVERTLTLLKTLP